MYSVDCEVENGQTDSREAHGTNEKATEGPFAAPTVENSGVVDMSAENEALDKSDDTPTGKPTKSKYSIARDDTSDGKIICMSHDLDWRFRVWHHSAFCDGDDSRGRKWRGRLLRKATAKCERG